MIEMKLIKLGNRFSSLGWAGRIDEAGGLVSSEVPT